MSNHGQVFRILDERLPLTNSFARREAAIRLSEILDAANLIAPTPPQPFFERGHGPNWEIPINDEDGGGVATVRALGRDVFIERPGHGHGHGFITNPPEARKIAAALLAAADYSEEV